MAMGMLVVPDLEAVDEVLARPATAQPTPTPIAMARKIQTVR